MPVTKKENLVLNINDLHPYPQNAKIHPDKQIKLLAEFIEKTGFIDPIVIDETDMILAGHARALAILRLKRETVECVRVHGLTDLEKKAYVLADNKLAEMGKWDIDLLSSEVMSIINEQEIDLSSLGFGDADIGKIYKLINEKIDIDHIDSIDIEKSENNYSKKIKSPVYEPTQEKSPSLDELFDKSKYDLLNDEINDSDLPEPEKEFLRLAATRHIVFNYNVIAEYYAHASKELQNLLERSALVVIDFNKAIENGFVVLTRELAETYEYDRG